MWIIDDIIYYIVQYYSIIYYILISKSCYYNILCHINDIEKLIIFCSRILTCSNINCASKK